MVKIDILKSFKQKKFKYGGYATLLTAIVLAVVIALNLVVSQLNLKLDLTQNKIFSLSEQTDTVLKGLKSDIKIIALFESGKEDITIKEILDKYTSKSNKISIEYVDPELHPEVPKQYAKTGETLGAGSLIVTGGSKNKTIDYYDLYNFSSETGGVQSLAVEQRVTSAIMYVTSDKNPKVYTLQGHNEQPLSSDLTKALGNENYTLEDLNLLSGEWKPEQGDILVISSMQRDISSEELGKIKDYLSKGGRAVFLMDIQANEGTLPNMQQLLNSYGVGLSNTLIYEGNSNNTIGGNRLYLLPNKSDHTILSPLNSSKLYVILPGAQPIVEVKPKKDSIKIEPLLTTSDKAYAKKNLQSKTQEKEEGDTSGAFNIAVAITDQLDYSDETKNPKIVLISSSLVSDSNMIQATNGGNLDFIMNSFSWLSDKTENVSIRAKDITSEYLNINGTQQLVVAGIAVIVIPLIVAVSGVSVWLRRRHL